MIILKLLQFHFLIADFNLLSCEFDSRTLNCCIMWFYTDKIKLLNEVAVKRIALTKLLLFCFFNNKDYCFIPALSKFALKLIC